MNIDRLILGFKSFKKIFYEKQPDFYRLLVEKGQKPAVMVISCSDSRVNPSIITQANPGELFIVRNVANVVPPYEKSGHHQSTSAAIEFAVRDLKVRDIIIMGHSHCGGIRRLCDSHAGCESREFIDDWLSNVKKAHDEKLKDETQYRQAEQEAIKISLDNLISFPWVKSRVDNKDLQLHGWWFDMEGGNLFSYEAKEGWKAVIT